MKNNFYKKLSIFIAVVGLLIFFNLLGLFKPLEGFVSMAINPISSRLYSWGSGFKSGYDDKKDKDDLLAKLKETEEKITELTVENARLKNLEYENLELRQHLNFLEDKKYTYVLANVISQEGVIDTGRQNDIILDKGSSDGLKEGLVVVDSHGVVIGKISEVKKKSSKVWLSTSNNCKLAVSIQNNDKTIGVTEGRLDLTIGINFIPQSEDLSKDNIVVTSGLEENIPRGLVVGKIESVNKNSNEVWQDVVISPIIPLKGLATASVLIP